MPEHTAAEQAPDAIPFASWWMLAVLFVFYTFSYLDRTVITVVAQHIKTDLGFTDTQMSLALGPAFTLVYALFGLPIGWASDRYPRRWVILFGLVLWSVAAAGTGLVYVLPMLLLARAGVAVGESALSPAAYSLLADRFPARRLAMAMATFQAALYVGQSSAFMLSALITRNLEAIHAAAPVLASLDDWRIVLILTGAPGLLIAALVFTFKEPARRGRATVVAGPLEEAREGFVAFLKRNARLLGLVLGACGVLAIAGFGVQAWYPTYIIRRFDLPLTAWAPVMSVLTIGAAVSMVLKGVLVDWLFGRGMRDAHIRAYSWLVAASLPFAAVMFVTGALWLFFVCWFLVTIFTFGYLTFVTPAMNLIAPPHLRGRMAALILGTFAGVGSLGPVIVGLLTDYVLKDPSKIGVALGGVLVSAIVIGTVMLRASLPLVREAIDRQLSQSLSDR